jgi:hypothetical protein
MTRQQTAQLGGIAKSLKYGHEHYLTIGSLGGRPRKAQRVNIRTNQPITRNYRELVRLCKEELSGL